MKAAAFTRPHGDAGERGRLGIGADLADPEPERREPQDDGQDRHDRDRTMTDTGNPSRCAPPRISKNESWIGRPTICFPSLSAEDRPKSTQPIARVAMSDGILMTWQMKALSAPTATAATRASPAATHGGMPCCISSAAVTDART